MESQLRRVGNSRLLAASIIAGVLLGIGVVSAAAGGPGNSTTFNGCENVQAGTLRLLPNNLPPPFDACITAGNPILNQQPALLEVPVSWNSVPPQEPQTTGVNCASGQTISAALQAAPVHLPLTVNISGTCTESVQVRRDNVTFNAVNPGDGITAPSQTQQALFINGGHHISLFGLTLTGGNGLSTTGGAGVFAMNLHITGAGTGILLTDASSGQFFNLNVDHSGQSGAAASSGSALSIGGGSITDSGSNGIDLQNGHAEVNNLTIARSGNMGISVRDGGSLEIQNSTVQVSGNTGKFTSSTAARPTSGTGLW